MGKLKNMMIDDAWWNSMSEEQKNSTQGQLYGSRRLEWMWYEQLERVFDGVSTGNSSSSPSSTATDTSVASKPKTLTLNARRKPNITTQGTNP